VDLDTDRQCGFKISYADEIEDIGYQGIVKKIRDIVGDNPVYSAYSFCLSDSMTTIVPVSFDIDVVDPGMAPAYVS
jgi:guanidinobutyrase / D-arginase